MTARVLIKMLEKDGWFEERQEGGHKHFRHSRKPGLIIVSNHNGDIPIGTLNAILKQAGIRGRRR